jgi:hypothetical protein
VASEQGSRGCPLAIEVNGKQVVDISLQEVVAPQPLPPSSRSAENITRSPLPLASKVGQKKDHHTTSLDPEMEKNKLIRDTLARSTLVRRPPWTPTRKKILLLPCRAWRHREEGTERHNASLHYRKRQAGYREWDLPFHCNSDAIQNNNLFREVFKWTYIYIYIVKFVAFVGLALRKVSTMRFIEGQSPHAEWAELPMCKYKKTKTKTEETDKKGITSFFY